MVALADPQPESVSVSHITSNYQFRRTTLSIVRGDITRVKADALVSSDDNYLSMGGGVSLALLKAGGNQVREDARKHVPLELGDVVATTAGKLQAKYIIHVVTIDFDKGVYAAEAHIREAMLRCLKLADGLAVRTLALPALGTGSGRFPAITAAEVMTQAIADYVAKETDLTQVTLVEYDREPLTEATEELRPGEFYAKVIEVAAELAQRRRFYDILDELQTITMAGPFDQDLDTLKRELDTLKISLRLIRDRAAAIYRLDPSSAETFEIAPLAEAPKLPGTEHIDIGSLREKLSSALDEEGVKTVAFDLGIDYGDLNAYNKAGMVRELIATLIRHETLGQLLDWIHQKRPDIKL